MSPRARRPGDPIRLVFLIADVGGGHRAPAEAVREALRRTVGDRARVELVDALALYAPFPYNRGRQTYTVAARWARPLLGAFFRALDGATRMRMVATVMRPSMRRAMRALRDHHPADLYVSFHPTYSYPLSWLDLPWAAVFVDLVAIHALWCAPGASCYIAATEAARERARRRGVPADRIEVTGLPVHPRLTDPMTTPRARVRERLGLGPGTPVILLTGGGEGMGPVLEQARAVGTSGLDAQLVVVAGRNRPLRDRLEASAPRWPMPTRVLGFTPDMPDWLAVATVLLTKAGTSTIAEALVCGVPMILFDAVPGQEEGNARYVLEAGAGAWCEGPAQVVETLRAWLGDPHRLPRLAEKARAAARPHAAFEVARIVWGLVEARARPASTRHRP
jgi:1,2-diacylglycerol 3-beta-galactosyltransferase